MITYHVDEKNYDIPDWAVYCNFSSGGATKGVGGVGGGGGGGGGGQSPQTQTQQQPTLKQKVCKAAAWSGGLLAAVGFGARAAAGGTALVSIITGSEVVLLESTPIGVPLAVTGLTIWATQRLVCD